MANKQAIIDSELDIPQKTMALIVCLGQEIKTEMTRKLKATGLSLIQLDILHALANSREKSLTVNQIKELMIDESPNVSRALNKLMDSGFIEKRRDIKDQRIVYIHITREGEKAHVDADKDLLTLKPSINSEDATKLFELLKNL